MVCQETFLPPSPLLANNFGPGIWMFSCNCVVRVEVKEAVGRSNYILKMFCYWYILEKLSKCLLYISSIVHFEMFTFVHRLIGQFRKRFI